MFCSSDVDYRQILLSNLDFQKYELHRDYTVYFVFDSAFELALIVSIMAKIYLLVTFLLNKKKSKSVMGILDFFSINYSGCEFVFKIKFCN